MDLRHLTNAARTVDPGRPVIAYLLEHNPESRGRAERSGPSLDDDVLAHVTAIASRSRRRRCSS